MSVQQGQTHLLCFSHLRWNFVYQRPQHLMSRAARDFTVWYFEEPVFLDDEPALRLRMDRSGVRVLTPCLPKDLPSAAVNTLLRAQLTEFLSEARPQNLVAWYYTPMALEFARELTPDITVYDNMDELSGFAGASPKTVALESELLSLCDVVFAGGRSLYEAKRFRHDNAHLFPSSVDVAHFAVARDAIAEPLDQKGLAKPRLGFFGVIDERMNLDLVAGVAAKRPEWQIVMIGPTAKIDPASLPRLDNINWLGIKDYGELPNYIAGWDVGLMPFALNDATRFISPTKTPEFLAAGKPVVSTPIADVVDPYGRAGLVEIAEDADGFVAAVENLLARPRENWLARVDRRLSRMSWDRTWSGMMERLVDAQAIQQQRLARHG